MKDRRPGEEKGTSHILCYVLFKTQYVGEWKKSLYTNCSIHEPFIHENLPITWLIVIFVWFTLLRKEYRWKTNRYLCILIYPCNSTYISQQRTSCSWTSKSSFFGLWQKQRCFLKRWRTIALNSQRFRPWQIQNSRLIRWHKRSSMTSSRI